MCGEGLEGKEGIAAIFRTSTSFWGRNDRRVGIRAGALKGSVGPGRWAPGVGEVQVRQADTVRQLVRREERETSQNVA